MVGHPLAMDRRSASTTNRGGSAASHRMRTTTKSSPPPKSTCLAFVRLFRWRRHPAVGTKPQLEEENERTTITPSTTTRSKPRSSHQATDCFLEASTNEARMRRPSSCVRWRWAGLVSPLRTLAGFRMIGPARGANITVSCRRGRCLSKTMSGGARSRRVGDLRTPI